jgi:hypothetical protein
MGSHGLLGDATATPLDMIIDVIEILSWARVGKRIYDCKNILLRRSGEENQKSTGKMSSGEKP